jgi:hypothetical protein
MERFTKIIILLMIATIPAAAPRDFAASPGLCFNAGSTTFQLAPVASAPDYRVRFVPQQSNPDLRVQLVDHVEIADFALVDDFAPMPGNPCRSAGRIGTIRIVGDEAPADVSISLSREQAEYKLFVQSARFGHRDAAALFAALLQDRTAQQLSDNN